MMSELMYALENQQLQPQKWSWMENAQENQKGGQIVCFRKVCFTSQRWVFTSESCPDVPQLLKEQMEQLEVDFAFRKA